jgi:hydroxyacylglutathione hydrolase
LNPTRVHIFDALKVGPLEVNCYLVGSEESRAAVCIDPGDEPEVILESVKRHGLRLEAVLLTHTHFDHVGAAAPVSAATGAPVYAPCGEEDMLSWASELAEGWGFSAQPAPEIARWISAGDVFEGDGYRLVALDVRGHSPAGLAFSADGDVFPGDALFAGSVGRTDLPGGHHSTLIDAIRSNLLTLDSETRVHPGHGPSTTVGEEARSNPYLTG